jgi:acyl carrier protein
MSDIVTRVLREEFALGGPLTDEKRFYADLMLDSLDAVEFIMALEERVGVDIPDEIAEGWETLGDVRAWLAARSTEPRP